MKGNFDYEGKKYKWSWKIFSYINNHYYGHCSIKYGRVLKCNYIDYNENSIYHKLIYDYSSKDKDYIINEIENRIISEIEFKKKEKICK